MNPGDLNVNMTLFLISVAGGYLLGSIPSAVWAGKIFHGIDIREHGSGNAGATNVIRVMGWKTGIPVMLADIAKGWLAAFLPHLLNAAEKGSSLEINMMIVAGLASITGHIYPLFAGFRGGKGVGTTVGVLIALNPLLTLSCLGVFLAVLFITGYVSVSSMSFGVSFPVLLFTLFDTPSLIFKVFSVFIALALIYTHRSNLKRLSRGEEPRFIKRKVRQ